MSIKGDLRHIYIKYISAPCPQFFFLFFFYRSCRTCDESQSMDWMIYYWYHNNRLWWKKLPSKPAYTPISVDRFTFKSFRDCGQSQNMKLIGRNMIHNRIVIVVNNLLSRNFQMQQNNSHCTSMGFELIRRCWWSL